MGHFGFCEILQRPVFSAEVCGFLRFAAKLCETAVRSMRRRDSGNILQKNWGFGSVCPFCFFALRFGNLPRFTGNFNTVP